MRKEGKTALVVITADRGLCGSFNANILRQAQAYLRENPDTDLITVGKKGRDFFKRRKCNIIKEWLYVFPHIPHETVLEMRDEIEGLFIRGGYKEILVLFTEFKSVISQKATMDTLLPIRLQELPGEAKGLRCGLRIRAGPGHHPQLAGFPVPGHHDPPIPAGKLFFRNGRQAQRHGIGQQERRRNDREIDIGI